MVNLFFFHYYFNDRPASSFVVRLGSHFLDSGEEYTVANLVIHHNHSGSDFFNDIALVRLASEVYITDKIAPICLPSPNMINDDFVGKLATVSGWGDTSFRKYVDVDLKSYLFLKLYFIFNGIAKFKLNFLYENLALKSPKF